MVCFTQYPPDSGVPIGMPRIRERLPFPSVLLNESHKTGILLVERLTFCNTQGLVHHPRTGGAGARATKTFGKSQSERTNPPRPAPCKKHCMFLLPIPRPHGDHFQVLFARGLRGGSKPSGAPRESTKDQQACLPSFSPSSCPTPKHDGRTSAQ